MIDTRIRYKVAKSGSPYRIQWGIPITDCDDITERRIPSEGKLVKVITDGISIGSVPKRLQKAYEQINTYALQHGVTPEEAGLRCCQTKKPSLYEECGGTWASVELANNRVLHDFLQMNHTLHIDNSILSFANQWGLLCDATELINEEYERSCFEISSEIVLPMPPPDTSRISGLYFLIDDDDDLLYCYGESIERWEQELQLIRLVNAALTYLNDDVSARAKSRATQIIEADREAFCNETKNPDIVKTWFLASPESIRTSVCFWINEHLQEYTASGLILNKSVAFYTPIPRTLLGYLWHLLALKFAEGNRVLPKCKACGNPMPSKRSTKKYCSPTCRKRAERQREKG